LVAVLAVGAPGHKAESAEFAENFTRGLLHTSLALLALSAVAFLSAKKRVKGGRLALAIVGVAVIDLVAVNIHAYVLVPEGRLHPASAFAELLTKEPGLHRVVTPFPPPDFGEAPGQPFEWEMEHGSALLYSGWNVDRRVSNFEPYTGLVPARAMRFQLRTGYLNQIPQVGMWGIDHAVVPLDEPDPGRAGISVPFDLAARDPQNRAALVRLPHRPRAYLAGEVASVDRRGAMEFVLDPSSVRSARSVVETMIPSGMGTQEGEVRFLSDEPERVVLEAKTDHATLLVLNDTYAPGWAATVDGAKAPILPANYLARGVFVGPGDHEVIFRYHTPGLRTGVTIALVLALSLFAWALEMKRRKFGQMA
jgi:hypothetical protein